LGLAIVRTIARAHGGEAHAANAETGGADVWIALPGAVPGTAGATEEVAVEARR
jgi:signal transduction histidine kinase